MNHCVDCGARVSRGGGNRYGNVIRCLVCETRRLFDGWRYETTTMKLRRLARQHDEQG